VEWDSYIVQINDDDTFTIELVPADHEGPTLYTEIWQKDIITDEQMGPLQEGTYLKVYADPPRIIQRYIPPPTEEELATIEAWVKEKSAFWLEVEEEQTKYIRSIMVGSTKETLMSKALQGFLDDANKPIPQSKAADERQVANNAGGFTFTVDDRARLERFLILGTDGGTYYVDQKTLTEDNATFVIDLIQRDAPLVINTLVEISRDGRALRQSPIIFTLALVFKYGNDEAKSVARSIFNDVIRISTHLFEFNQYIESLGGWGRAKRSAVAGWYTGRDAAALAYQAVKYRQRNGWTHRDALRLAHPIGVDAAVINFILGKDERTAAATTDGPAIIRGFKFAQEAQTVSELLGTALTDYPNLPWEALPTQFLTEPEVWKKLFYNGQLNGQALVRNITRLSRINAFNDMVFARDYANRLVDGEMIRRTRLHPLNYLNALVVHQVGQIDRKNHTYGWGISRIKNWTTVPVIVDALNNGFYAAFKHLESANKRTMLALDVSGSMSAMAGSGLDLSCDQVTAAMSMATARTEPWYQITAFDTGIKDLGITPGQNLAEVLQRVHINNGGGTDCSLPMTWALKTKTQVDTFVVYTDNETWAGRIHPHIALQEYRQKMGIDAKLAVVGIAATKFTIADPSDRGMIDLVGADSNLPAIIANFSAGRV